eukprot:g6195.t1
MNPVLKSETINSSTYSSSSRDGSAEISGSGTSIQKIPGQSKQKNLDFHSLKSCFPGMYGCCENSSNDKKPCGNGGNGDSLSFLRGVWSGDGWGEVCRTCPDGKFSDPTNTSLTPLPNECSNPADCSSGWFVRECTTPNSGYIACKYGSRAPTKEEVNACRGSGTLDSVECKKDLDLLDHDSNAVSAVGDNECVCGDTDYSKKVSVAEYFDYILGLTNNSSLNTNNFRRSWYVSSNEPATLWTKTEANEDFPVNAQPIFPRSCQRQCPAGRFAATNHAACIVCAQGKYNDSIGQGSCKDCEAGKVRSSSDSPKSCILCPVGQFPATDKSQCKHCDAGKVLDNGVCRECGVGKYGRQVSDSAAECILCNAGRYQDQTGRTNCKACSVGKYQNHKGRETCYNCTYGKYAGSSFIETNLRSEFKRN